MKRHTFKGGGGREAACEVADSLAQTNWRRKNRTDAVFAAWLIFHGAVAAIFALGLIVRGGTGIDTDFLAMLPEGSAAYAPAEKALSEAAGRRVLFLVTHTDLEKAEAAAAFLDAELTAAGAAGAAGTTPCAKAHKKSVPLVARAQARRPPVEKANSLAQTNYISQNRTDAVLAAGALFESRTFYLDGGALDEAAAFTGAYKYRLLDDETIALLEAGRAEAVAAAALERAYAGLGISGIDSLESDPFLLADAVWERRLNTLLAAAGSFAPVDAAGGRMVLAAQKDGLWNVMIQGLLAPQALSLGGKNGKGGGLSLIDASIARAEAAFPGAKVYPSGIPFHTAASAAGAQREIAILSGLSLVLILGAFLFVFRSAVPAAFALAAGLLSIASAAAAALGIFGRIHIITFVFGSTLIGCAVDYSIHYFTSLKALGTNLKTQTSVFKFLLSLFLRNKMSRNKREVRESIEFFRTSRARAAILRGTTLSCISTEICFAALLFAPFPLVRQFALFSLFGMASAYLTVLGFRFRGCSEWGLGNRERGMDSLGRDMLSSADSKVHSDISEKNPVPSPQSPVPAKILFPIFLAVLAIILIVKHEDVRINNNVRDLYTPSPRLRESEAYVAGVMKVRQAPWYYIVSAESPEALLEKEEALTRRLRKLTEAGSLGGFLAVSDFIPSERRQEHSYRAATNLLPHLEAQCAALGLPAGTGEAVWQEYAESAVRPLRLPAGGKEGGGAPMPAFLKQQIANLYLGNIGGAYYSCVLLFSPDLPAAGFEEAAADGIALVNRTAGIEAELNNLTRTMLLLFLAAYIVLVIVIKICYPWKTALRIAAVPPIVTAAALAAAVLAGGGIGFFSLCAFVLVFGLGLDYMFYLTGKNYESRTAVTLSFATTAFSFAILGFSSFAPVHIFGVVVFAGIAAAFISALALSGNGGGGGIK